MDQSSFLKERERERERCGIRCPTPLRALRAQQNQFMKGKNDLSGLLPLLLYSFFNQGVILKNDSIRRFADRETISV